MWFSKLNSLKPISWVLLATFWFNILRLITVPLGANIDESFHVNAIVTVANELKFCVSGRLCDLSKLSALGGGNLDFLRGVTYYIPLGIGLAIIPKSLTEPEIFYALRFFSVLLHLITLIFAYYLCQKFFSNRTIMSTFITGILAFIPSYGDMMSGVTIEISVAMIGSLGLVIFTRLLATNKPSFDKIVLVGGIIGLAYATKGTAWVIILVALLIFFLNLPNLFKLSGCLLGALGLTAYIYFASPFSSPQQASWYYLRNNLSAVEVSPEVANLNSSVSSNSLRVSHQYDNIRYSQNVTLGVVQYLPEQVVPSLRKATIMCGVWVRTASSNGAEILPPNCSSVKTFLAKTTIKLASKTVAINQISTEWTFISQRFEVEASASELGYFLDLPENSVPLLYDGAVLVKGDMPTTEIPVFLDSRGAKVKWGNKIYENLLRNSSGEQIWWLTRPETGYPYLVNDRLAAVLDWQRTWPAWIRLTRWLLTNFWSSFGGLLAGLTSRQMTLLVLATSLAIVGNIKIILWNLPKRLPPYNRRSSRLIFIMLVSTALISLGIVLYRADLVAYEEMMLVWSSMRHATAGQIAFAALLGLGWWEWFPRKWRRPLSASVILTLYLIAIYIFLKIQYPFQHCAYTEVEWCLYSLY